MPSDNLICIAGPTAVGKSAVALELARLLNGEIVSVDSMQVYQGLDIGTAKPGPIDRAQVPHHMIDLVSLRETFDAADFVRLAKATCADIVSRGRVPILCGGTGLYFKALFVGLPQTPETNPALRYEIESSPLSSLLEELRVQDPVAFDRIDKKNPRRVMRAIEVIRLTGRPFSDQRADWSGRTQPRSEGTEVHHSPGGQCFVLERDPADLKARMEMRVDEMFRAGLVEETERLLQGGLRENRAAMQAIGYRQIVRHLETRGPLASMIEEVKIKTRQFAKRQRTWFRTQYHGETLHVKSDEAPLATARRVMERCQDIDSTAAER